MMMPTSGFSAPGDMAAHSSKPARARGVCGAANRGSPWHGRCKLCVLNDDRDLSAPPGRRLRKHNKLAIYKAVFVSAREGSLRLGAVDRGRRVTKSVVGETLLVSRPGHGRVFTWARTMTTDFPESLLRDRPPSPGPTRTDVGRRVSVFLPAFNEVDNLEGAVADIVWAASQVLDEYEILIIDDGSTDGTGALADRLASANPRIRAIHQPRNMGIAAAYERALAEARLDHFSFLASDGEIARESVRDILGSVGRADIVAPYHQNPLAREPHRRFLTWASTALVNVLFGQRMHYYQGPCIYPVALARALPKSAGGFYFLTQMLIHALHAGYTYVEVGLTHVDRTHGRSKAVSAKNILKALRTIAQAWWAIHLGGGSVARRA